MKHPLRLVLTLLGFEKLDKTERAYLHDANIRTSAYMGAIVVLLELWMLIRQTHYKIVPKLEEGNALFGLIVKYTSKYWLFLLVGLGLTLFCLFQRQKKLSKGQFRALIGIGCACILYTAVLSLEAFTQVSDSVTPVMANIMNAMLVSIYALLFIIGVTIVSYAVIKYRTNRRAVPLEYLAIVGFNLLCLAFGIYVSYSDFWGGKEIICFLTMVIYVGCLLIYRPYITILILTASFWAFHSILLTYQGGLSFEPIEVVIGGVPQRVISGDSVNYVTFLISMITVCFAIYQGRLKEARESKALEKSAREDGLTGMNSYSYFLELAEERMRDLPEPGRASQQDAQSGSLSQTADGRIGDSNTAPRWASLRAAQSGSLSQTADGRIGDSNTAPDDNVFLFIDVHNFKAFNDQRGFEAGNRFLIDIGGYLSEIFRDSLCARQADDHFVVLTRTENLQEKLDLLNRRVRDYDDQIRLGINCGGYHLSTGKEDPRMAIDRARYATQLIRNRFQTIYTEYDKTMNEAYRKRLYIVNNIDNAVENGWIVPFYQPVVWSDTRELCGCEALARWMDPVYGQLFPNEFIPVLEEYRLIHKLDRSIFESVCRDLRSSMDSGKPVVPVSLNFSRLDFELMDAVQELENLVTAYAIPRALIHVEVTESALADNLHKLHESINRFKEMGYSLWLDDFGSGYSSLNVLKDYSFDVVKIDMRFLSNFENSEKSRTLIDCIVKMADRINMLTLTEGVETEAQAQFLNQVGCTRLQGYLFGRPIPRDAFYARIEKGEMIVSAKPSEGHA